jgi:hypothetical protein
MRGCLGVAVEKESASDSGVDHSESIDVALALGHHSLQPLLYIQASHTGILSGLRVLLGSRTYKQRTPVCRRSKVEVAPAAAEVAPAAAMGGNQRHPARRRAPCCKGAGAGAGARARARAGSRAPARAEAIGIAPWPDRPFKGSLCTVIIRDFMNFPEARVSAQGQRYVVVHGISLMNHLVQRHELKVAVVCLRHVT